MRDTGESLMTVKMAAEDILRILRKNRTTHNKNYDEAKIAWRKECIAIMKVNLHAAQEGKKIVTSFHITQPVRYDQSYADAIEMLEMTTDDTVVLSPRDFQSYIKDKWDWAGSFAANTMSYMAGYIGATADEDDD